MIEIIQRPEIVEESVAYKWNCVGNPIVYRMQRKDFTFDQINDSGGFVQLQFNGTDVTGSFAIGDSVYIKADNEEYDIFGLVTAESFAANTLITLDVAYTAAAPGGFVNNITLRPAYRLEVEIYNVDDELLTVDPFTYSPNSKGLLIVDVSGILRNLLTPDFNGDLTAATEAFNDEEVYTSFYLKYTEVWTGSAEAQTNDEANVFYGVFGARQIPSAYGGNLLEYVISSDIISASAWEEQTAAQANAWRSVTFGVGIFVAVSSNGVNRIMSSTDGETWTARSAGVTAGWQGVCFGNALFVAVAATSGGNMVTTSPDGINWTPRAESIVASWQDVVWGGALFVAVANGGAGNRVMTSPDGINWTTRVEATTDDWLSITYGAGLYVAVSNTGIASQAVMTSPDGINWTSRVAPTTGWTEVAYNGTYFVAVGSNGVMRSADGITWTAETESSNHNWAGLWFYLTIWVAVSSDGFSMLSFDDGETWEDKSVPVANGWTSVTHGNYMFVSVAGSGATDLVMTLESVTPNTGKFLTRLNQPVMWRGWPMLMGALIEGPSLVYLEADNDETTPAIYDGQVVSFNLNEILDPQTADEFTIVIKKDFDDVAISEELTIQLRDACENPIMLLGRNSLGGPLQWLFDGSQEYLFDYGNGIKNKRLVLVAENLTVDEWEKLQDFITLGEVYKNNIVEFDSSVIKSNSRIGQQLYVLAEDGSKIGVIAIPTRNKTHTRQIKHVFEIEIEYPETFAP